MQDGETGMFRGPYLDVRLPFRKTDESWARTAPLDFAPAFAPYAHQLRAFERLSARDGKPQNTLITTDKEARRRAALVLGSKPTALPAVRRSPEAKTEEAV